MANLLSFLGGAANRVANTVNHDVLQPIQRDVVAPVQHAAGAVNNAAVQAPAQVYRNVVAPTARFGTAAGTPFLNAGLGLVNSAYKTAMIVPNEARTINAIVTHNPVAARSAFNQAGEGLDQVRQLLQFTPRAFVKAAASIPGTTPHVTDNVYQPNNSLVNKVLLGNEPITSIENTYKTTPGGGVSKVSNTALDTLMTVLGVTGGVESVKKGIEKIPTDQSTQIEPPLQPKTLPTQEQSLSALGGKQMIAPETPAKILPKTLDKSLANPTTSGLPSQVENTLNGIKVSNPSNVVGAAKEVGNLFSPGKDTKAIQNDLRASTGNLALEKGQAAQASSSAVKFFDKQMPQNNVKFIQTIESGIKQPTPQLQALADTFRQGFNKDYQLAQTLKPDLPYVKDYFAQSGIWADPKAAQAFVDKWVTPSLGGKPGALEHRTFPTIYDGIKNGLQLKETNPATIALNNHAQLLKAKMAQDFLAEQAAKGVDPVMAQKVVDRYLQPGFGGSAIYKTAKDAGYALNNIQLGLSGFHVTGTGLNAVFSEFANGIQSTLTGHPLKGAGSIIKAPFAPLDYVLKGNKIISDFKSGNITPDIQNIAEGGGRVTRQVDYQTTGLAKSIQDWNQGKKVSAVANAPLRAFSTAAKPIMEWWVPRIKAGAEKALIDRKVSELGSNASPEAMRAAKAAAIDAVDNRFGQLTQDNLFWDKRIKDGMGIFMRSPGWNIGTVREVGGGAANLLKPSTYADLVKGKGLPENTAYTLSLGAGTMMISSAIQYMFTGKPPTSAIDYFYPKTGQTDKNGNAERVSLPTYSKDIFAFVHNPAQTLSNKSSPALSEALQLGSNKDYFGNMIRNPQDSAGTQAKQLGDYLLKSNMPFSLQGANQRVDKGIGTKVQSFAGLNPAPGYITKSGFQQNVEGALNQKLGNTPLTPEQVALNNQKSQAKQAAKFGDNSQIDKLVQSGQLTKKQGDNLKQESSNTSLLNEFNYLLKVDRGAAANLIKGASPQDIAKLGDLTPLLTDMAKATQNKLATQATKDASQKLFDQLNNTGKSISDFIPKKIAKAKAPKAAAAPKVKKTTVAKAKKLPSFKLSSIKAPRISGIKIKKPTAYKPVKTRKLSVSKIPSSATTRKLA